MFPWVGTRRLPLPLTRPVFAGFEVPFVDVFDPVAADTKPLNFELHPFGRPIAVTHFGGSVAKDMAAQGEAAMKVFRP